MAKRTKLKENKDNSAQVEENTQGILRVAEIAGSIRQEANNKITRLSTDLVKTNKRVTAVENDVNLLKNTKHLTLSDLEKVKKDITPKKGVDYFDGEKGQDFNGEGILDEVAEELVKVREEFDKKIESEDLTKRLLAEIEDKLPKQPTKITGGGNRFLAQLKDVDVSGLTFTNGKYILGSGSGGGGEWGSITGTLADQTDLQSALDAKLSADQTTASNGLTLSGLDVQLGGTLTGDTEVDVGTNTLLFTGDIDNSGTIEVGVSDTFYTSSFGGWLEELTDSTGFKTATNAIYGGSSPLIQNKVVNATPGSEATAEILQTTETLELKKTDDTGGHTLYLDDTGTVIFGRDTSTTSALRIKDGGNTTIFRIRNNGNIEQTGNYTLTGDLETTGGEVLINAQAAGTADVFRIKTSGGTTFFRVREDQTMQMDGDINFEGDHIITGDITQTGKQTVVSSFTIPGSSGASFGNTTTSTVSADSNITGTTALANITNTKWDSTNDITSGAFGFDVIANPFLSSVENTGTVGNFLNSGIVFENQSTAVVTDFTAYSPVIINGDSGSAGGSITNAYVFRVPAGKVSNVTGIKRGVSIEDATLDNYFAGTLEMGSGTTINEFSIDGTLAGDSDDALPTEKAVKTYVDAATPAASATVSGLVELATDAETATGTATDRAVTPANLASYTPQVITVKKSSDETINSSTTLQNDDDLSFSIGANEIWSVTWFIAYTSGTTPDFKCNFSMPSGCASLSAKYDTLSSYTTGDITAPGSGFLGVQLIKSIFTNSSNAGSVTFQWAQQTSDAGDTIVHEESHLIATRIA